MITTAYVSGESVVIETYKGKTALNRLTFAQGDSVGSTMPEAFKSTTLVKTYLRKGFPLMKSRCL